MFRAPLPTTILLLCGLAAFGGQTAAHAQTPEPPDVAALPPLEPIPADIAQDLDPNAALAVLPNDSGDVGIDWPNLSQPLPLLPPLPTIAADNTTPQGNGDAVADIAASPSEHPPAAPNVSRVELATVGTPAPADGLAPNESDATGDSSDTSIAASGGRYSVILDAQGAVADDAFLLRFAALSELRQNDRNPANRGQINRRAAADTILLNQMLRTVGYYDATVTSAIANDGARLTVTFSIVPGPQYHFRSITLPGLAAVGQGEAARLAPSLASPPDRPLAAGDVIDADRLVAAQANLASELRETGYPFSAVGDETVTIDHDVRGGTLDQPVAPGARLRFGQVLADDGGILGSAHIQRIARFRAGQWYRQSDIDDLRRALIATGLVASIDIRPRDAGDGEHVNIGVALTPSPPRTVSGLIGFSSGEGVRAEVSWEHRNLFPPEGALIFNGVIGTRQQLFGATFRRNNWQRRDYVLSFRGLVNTIDTDAFNARTVNIGARIERTNTLIFQKRWSWAAGLDIIGTDELAFDPNANIDRRQRYLIGVLYGIATYDRSNDLLNPTRGFRLSGRISPEVSFDGTAFGYVRLQLDGSFYQPVGDRVVLAARSRIASIQGVGRDSVAPSRRYYAGGGGSVRGYGYQAIGPRSPGNRPIGGASLFEFAVEARVRAFGAFSLVPFVDAGNVYDSGFPGIDGLRVGAGIGIRYQTNFGPIRVDVGTPLNPRPGDSRLGVYVSLGQAF